MDIAEHEAPPPERVSPLPSFLAHEKGDDPIDKAIVDRANDAGRRTLMLSSFRDALTRTAGGAGELAGIFVDNIRGRLERRREQLAGSLVRKRHGRLVQEAGTTIQPEKKAAAARRERKTEEKRLDPRTGLRPDDPITVWSGAIARTHEEIEKKNRLRANAERKRLAHLSPKERAAAKAAEHINWVEAAEVEIRSNKPGKTGTPHTDCARALAEVARTPAARCHWPKRIQGPKSFAQAAADVLARRMTPEAAGSWVTGLKRLGQHAVHQAGVKAGTAFKTALIKYRTLGHLHSIDGFTLVRTPKKKGAVRPNAPSGSWRWIDTSQRGAEELRTGPPARSREAAAQALKEALDARRQKRLREQERGLRQAEVETPSARTYSTNNKGYSGTSFDLERKTPMGIMELIGERPEEPRPERTAPGPNKPAPEAPAQPAEPAGPACWTPTGVPPVDPGDPIGANPGEEVRILICGPRRLPTGNPSVSKNLREIIESTAERANGPLIIIHCGGNGEVDRLVETWARETSTRYRTFEPDWKNVGKSAAFRRNEDMLDRGSPTLVLALATREDDAGTEHIATLAVANGVPVEIAGADGQTYPHGPIDADEYSPPDQLGELEDEAQGQEILAYWGADFGDETPDDINYAPEHILKKEAPESDTTRTTLEDILGAKSTTARSTAGSTPPKTAKTEPSQKAAMTLDDLLDRPVTPAKTADPYAEGTEAQRTGPAGNDDDNDDRDPTISRS